MDYDFCGWATKNGVRCSDERIILKDAFAANDGKRVPLVWNHLHDDPENVLGHATLENRPEGVYAYGRFNNTSAAAVAKALVEHGDINSLSICANKVKINKRNNEIYHGNIVEVSLVHGGANPEAFIEDVITHSEDDDSTAIIYTGEEFDLAKETIEINHAAESESNDSSDKTIGDIFNTLNAEQKEMVYSLVGVAISQAVGDSDEEDTDEEEDTVKHNVFENNHNQEHGTDEIVLTHADQAMIIGDMKRCGSLKESFITHSADYGIEQIDWLFPEAKNPSGNTPGFIKRDTGWVSKVMEGVHHTPFSRIKSMFADITEDEARARGYMKGKLKKEEVFSLLKRTTTPTTIYKKQKLDRDDIIDITDFDVVAWLKSEMRMMLNEELARSYLIGDGRLPSSDDKINEQNIRPISKDEELYTIQVEVAEGSDTSETAKAFIRAAIKSRKDYKGSGQPTLYTTEDMLTDMLLLEDGIGHSLYVDEAALARKLRVKEIVTVPVMDDAKGKDDKPLIGIIVNLNDYNVGADRGGAVSMFDDFDIDYNQQKYLIETRCSGALIIPKSAIAFQLGAAG